MQRGIEFLTEEMGKDETIIIVSDTHLGIQEHIDKRFYSFLQKLKTTQNGDDNWCDRLILAGDTIDLWRCSIPDALEKTQNIQNLLQDIEAAGQIRVQFIVGNHDYYFRNRTEQEKSPKYKFPFEVHLGLELTRTEDSKRFHIIHGDEFDWIQIKKLYDPLCRSERNWGRTWDLFREYAPLGKLDDDDPQKSKDVLKMSDEDLKVLEKARALSSGGVLLEQEVRLIRDLLKLPEDVPDEEINLIIKMLARVPEVYGRDMYEPDPHVSLGAPGWLKNLIKLGLFPGVEKVAYNYADSNDSVLIFGHTHKAFICSNKNPKADKVVTIANTGCWNDFDHLIQNSYIKIKNQTITLNIISDDNSIKCIDSKTIY